MARNAEFHLLATVACRGREGNERDFESAALHGELLHGMRYASCKLVCCKAPLFRKLVGEPAPRCFGRRGALCQRLAVGCLRKRREPRLGLDEQVRQCFGTHAILSRCVVNGRLPLFDARKLRGIEIELLAIRA